MTIKTTPATGGPSPPLKRKRHSPVFWGACAAAAGLAGTATLVLALGPIGPAMAATASFPGAGSTGVPAKMALKTVPGNISSGPGWSYNSGLNMVEVSGSNVTLSGLYIPCNLDITGSHVTINDVKVVTGGNFGISLKHTAGVTIENSTISGLNATTGRVGSAIDDTSGDSTGMVVKNNNISLFKSAVQLVTGTVTGNYMHDPGYIAGDHTNGVIGNGGTGKLTITNNTILNSLSQTDAITIDTSQVAGPVSNKIIENNLLGGGAYVIYGGTAFGHTTSNILIENNRFSQAYWPKSGQFGPVAYFDSKGAGNVWTGNVWDSNGQTVPAP